MERYLEITRKIKITDEDIDDIMVSALEGGICYWCCKAEVIEDDYFGEYASDQISRGGSLRLYDSEEDEVYVLTLDKFMRGLQLAFEQGYYRSYWLDGDMLDTCQIDSADADVIVQLALFGEVVFG